VTAPGNLCGIAVLPDEGTAEQVARAQALCAGALSASMPALGRPGNRVHASVFQFPACAATPWEQLLDVVASDLPAHTATVVGLSRQEPGWVFLDLEPDSCLNVAAVRATQACQEFVERADLFDESVVGGYPHPEQIAYRRFGYRYAGELFRPHFTVGYLDADAGDGLPDQVVDAFGQLLGLRVMLQRISAYRAGPLGSYASTLAERYLP